MPLSLVATLLREAASLKGELILVGGQALAYWLDRYKLSLGIQVPAVTRDVDFLALDATNRRAVECMAHALAGKAIFPHEKALTALLGQAVRELPGQNEWLNVDILCKVFQIGKEAVADWAVEVEWLGATIRAMHPLHVLMSRLHNLYKLQNKQDALGEAQLRGSIEVMRAFTQEIGTMVIDDARARGTRLLYARKIEHLARLDAGRKVAQRHGIHVADAIEVEAIDHANFRNRKLPRLLPLMSAQRARELADLLVAATPADG